MQRKRYPIEFKQQLIQEAQETGNASQVARRHEIDVKMSYRWIRDSKHTDWKNTPADAKAVTLLTKVVIHYDTQSWSNKAPSMSNAVAIRPSHIFSYNSFLLEVSRCFKAE
ncbi:transposase [Brevibacillus sp. 179-C9.3 HS]|uniref:transposase n=1 Tax=unclassified Brevibacillus TaxID=2684853 RepID=UPI0039A3B9C2